MRQVLEAVPAQRNTLMFSATIPLKMVELANELMSDPLFITVGAVSSEEVVHVKPPTPLLSSSPPLPSLLPSPPLLSSPLQPSQLAEGIQHVILWEEEDVKKKRLFTLLKDKKHFKLASQPLSQSANQI